MNELSWKLVLELETAEHFSVYTSQSRLARLTLSALNYVHVR